MDFSQSSLTLACPSRGGDRHDVHRRHRAPTIDHRCRDCRGDINTYISSILHSACTYWW
jgi:hypothetical protein